jgi:hypothetical protein
MKNTHVLQTEKPSRLYKIRLTENLQLLEKTYLISSDSLVITQNIYITSDEEIKEGDYWLNLDRNDINNGELFDIANMALSCKKIILTTDQDLIKDGVQAIDDEFLEWFVKNPSCEFVEFDKEEDELVSPKNPKIKFNYLQDPPSFISAESLNNMILTYKYKIIIPQEEPK